jgi:hypothetical protein
MVPDQLAGWPWAAPFSASKMVLMGLTIDLMAARNGAAG